jgi:hypothetical protein
MFEGPCLVECMSIIVQQDACTHTHTHKNIQFIFICKLLYMFRVVTPPIIRSSYHCICSSWHYWDHSSHPVTFKTGSSTVSIMPDTADTVIWAPDDKRSYHSKHVEQFTDINKLYIVTSCWTIIDICLIESFGVTVWGRKLLWFVSSDGLWCDFIY